MHVYWRVLLTYADKERLGHGGVMRLFVVNNTSGRITTKYKEVALSLTLSPLLFSSLYFAFRIYFLHPMFLLHFFLFLVPFQHLFPWFSALLFGALSSQLSEGLGALSALQLSSSPNDFVHSEYKSEHFFGYWDDYSLEIYSAAALMPCSIARS